MEEHIGSRGDEAAVGSEFFAATLDHLRDGVVACDANGQVTLVNRTLRETFGIPPRPVIDEEWITYYGVSEPDGTPLSLDRSALTRALNGEVVQGLEVVATDLEGSRHHLVVNAQPIFEPGKGKLGAVMTLHDVTNEREAEARAERQRLHDPLTGLANRTQFLLQLARTLVDGAGDGAVLLHIDLDRFRQVNDHLGQSNGDHVLLDVGARLAAVAGDAVVARVGGDEFAILATGVHDQQDAMLLASRIRDALAAPILVAGEEVRITAALGIALARERSQVPENLLRDAEAATRRAKEQGPSNYEFFSREMRISALERIEDQRALDQALALHQFRLVYQPKLTLNTDRITGAEALLRWERPDGQTVAPAHFIPLAEESGMIVPLGTWVLQETAAQGARWSTTFPDHPPMRVCANVSPRQFRASLIPTVRRVLVETDIDPALLYLELTESAVMADVDETIAILRGLKELGVGISIDDFGTGYSSLAYLKRFPLDELKIDRSFVAGIGRDPEDTAIVGAVIAMAHALQLEVVAEGVETSEQLDRLRSLGCDHVQGYLIARPTTADAIDILRHGESSDLTAGQELGRGRRVLVVDDTNVVRQLARVSLSTAGFDVHEAATAAEGIALARTLRPDCVVLDVRLPDGLGYDVCMQLRADPTTAGTTIVMLTAEADAEAKIAAFSAGVDDYMVKPFSPRDIVGRVTAAVRRRGAAAG